MKTLDAGQASLLAGAALSVVTLCKLTTYSNRTTLTVQATRYFSDGARLYDWANEGTTRQFEPWLLRMDAGRDTMNHLPSLDGSGIESALRRRRVIVLRNWLPETATYLYQTLRAENLEHARIEIAQLFVDRGATTSFNDLTSFAGSEQTWLFRGVVAAVLNVDEQEIELECVAELPQIPWLYANVPSTNDPKDLGARVAVCLGTAKRVPAIGWDVGWTTTLATPADAVQATLILTDATGLPTSGVGARAYLGTEEVWWTGKSGNTLTGVTRNRSGTRKQSHKAGAILIEAQTTSTWVLSGVAASAVPALYVLSPLTNELVRITTAFTTTLSNTTLISGSTVATVSFTQAQITALMNALYAAAEIAATTAIAAQPVVSHAVLGTSVVNQLPITGPSAVGDNNVITAVTLTPGIGVTVGFQSVSNMVSQQVLVQCYAQYTSQSFVVYAGGTIIGTVTGTGSIQWFTFPTTNLSNSIEVRYGGPTGTGNVYEVHRNAQVGNPAPTLSQGVSLTELELAGLSVGFGLRLVADVNGPLASGGVYSVGNGVLISKMPDVLRYVLADLCGLGHSAIDASFNTLAGVTYLDDNAHGLDLRDFGFELLDVLAALSYESRANLISDERTAATTYRLLAALSTYAWPASARTLTKWQQVVEEGRDAEAIRTRFTHLYQWHSELGLDVEAFAAAVQTTVAAAEVKFGRHDADPIGLRTVDLAATATEIAGYYEQERSRVAALWRMSGVPWTDGYDLERGDLVSFTPPWAGAKKGRVIETMLRTDGLVDLRIVEVS